MIIKEPKTADFFAIGRLLAKLNVNDQIKELAKQLESGAIKNDQFEIGFAFIMPLIEKAVTVAEDDIYAILQTVSDATEEDLQNPNMFLEVIEGVFNSAEWRAVFTKAAKMILRE